MTTDGVRLTAAIRLCPSSFSFEATTADMAMTMSRSTKRAWCLHPPLSRPRFLLLPLLLLFAAPLDYTPRHGFVVADSASNPRKTSPPISARSQPPLILLPRGRDVLRDVMIRLRSDVLSYRNEVERAHSQRCSSGTLTSCHGNNYDECLSALPDPDCPGADDYNAVPECGLGIKCNGLFDWSVSTVRLPRALGNGVHGNPTDPQIIETVCYSRQTDDFLINMFEDDGAFWEERGMYHHPVMYFGAADGSFRIFPARQSALCGTYDPRKRPWYIAAVPWYISETSGGRDVLIVLDNSRSVGSNNRLGLFQNATKSIIERLTAYDRVGVVIFNEDAEVAGGFDSLRPYDAAVKNALFMAIDAMEPLGRTNYLAALDVGFDLLGNTPPPEDGTKCNTAVLFFTDGPMNYPLVEDDGGAQEVVSLYKRRLSSLPGEVAGSNSTQFFAYSAIKNDMMRRIACGVDGIWKGLTNTTKMEELVSDYHKFFALGLGDEANTNFTAWVGPYEFSTGGISGVTSSALVFDRSVSPAQFLGAVGADLTMARVESILGYGGTDAVDAVREIMEDLTTRPTVRCPVRLDRCELEAARYLSGGKMAVCGDANVGDDGTWSPCENRTGVLPSVCTGRDEYPANLWANIDTDGLSYQERVCCQVGQPSISDQCPDVDLYGEPLLSDMAIFGIILGAIALVEIIACIYWQTGCAFMRCGGKNEKTSTPL